MIGLDGAEQADDAFLQGIVKLQPRADGPGGGTAQQRHHVGEHRGHRGLLPCPRAGQRLWREMDHKTKPPRKATFAEASRGQFLSPLVYPTAPGLSIAICPVSHKKGLFSL